MAAARPRQGGAQGGPRGEGQARTEGGRTGTYRAGDVWPLGQTASWALGADWSRKNAGREGPEHAAVGAVARERYGTDFWVLASRGGVGMGVVVVEGAVDREGPGCRGRRRRRSRRGSRAGPAGRSGLRPCGAVSSE